jgi:hypothetical protein
MLASLSIWIRRMRRLARRGLAVLCCALLVLAPSDGSFAEALPAEIEEHQTPSEGRTPTKEAAPPTDPTRATIAPRVVQASSEPAADAHFAPGARARREPLLSAAADLSARNGTGAPLRC